ncbi:histidinol-phosphatase [Schaalia sp. 19OD2882]|uniref:histidinol-phosphatase n=1 Tax=Schaalia sp. 19OD2882 TaxID=2794089 RepID=UPI001C1EB448|nr:histidinol-phosphatase [Schaalia sp. 19OD2882]QWW20319.1 histidinol-phosphatase [Schaalia sp. 19OD2882]
MSTPLAHEDDLRLAHLLADEADAITMSRFGAEDLLVESKPDLTPVSDADRAAEDALRAILAEARPGDSVLGEERGTTGQARRQWIIDPIDGTMNFVRGVPVWATLIALVEDDEVRVGVVSAPALGTRWWARRGGGAWTGRTVSEARRIHVSKVARLEDASLSYASISSWAAHGLGDEFAAFLTRFWRTRAYGDFWSYMLLAQGAVDVAAEPELEVYDMAALVPIVVEAGGRFTDLSGGEGPWGGNAVASNSLLHEECLKALRAPH